MANPLIPKYSSIMDNMLGDSEVEDDSLGLTDVWDDSWSTSNRKETALEARLREKESAASSIGAARTANFRSVANTEHYKSAAKEDNNLLDELTYSLDEAVKGSTVEKRSRTDAEIQKYIRDLLNQGTPPNKVAGLLDKLAEIELFNRQMSTRYLQDNAGLLGITYLEPNTFMDKQNPNYSRTASSSQDCVRQYRAWKAACITPRAKCVKQVSACTGCSYFKRNASTKSCGLYGLPVVGSSQELQPIVNSLTPGVPAGAKKSALVQIANRVPEQGGQNIKIDSTLSRQASTQERSYGFKESQHFTGDQVRSLHKKGHTLRTIASKAANKYGSLEASKGIREFIASLPKEEGKIYMLKADVDFLKSAGIRNEAFAPLSKEEYELRKTKKSAQKVSKSEMVTRAEGVYTPVAGSSVRKNQLKTSSFGASKVANLQGKGYSVANIYKAASIKYGSVVANKAILEWARNLKNTNTKIALSQIDCTQLAKMGVKLASQNAIIGEPKCASCSYRNGMNCGLTGGTLLSFPGMNQPTNKKSSATSPKDGHGLLDEFDLSKAKHNTTIDINEPDRHDIEMSNVMDAGEL